MDGSVWAGHVKLLLPTHFDKHCRHHVVSSPDMHALLLKPLLCVGWELGVCKGRVALDGGLEAHSYSQGAPEVQWRCQGDARHWCVASGLLAAELAPAVQMRLDLFCLTTKGDSSNSLYSGESAASFGTEMFESTGVHHRQIKAHTFLTCFRKSDTVMTWSGRLPVSSIMWQYIHCSGQAFRSSFCSSAAFSPGSSFCRHSSSHMFVQGPLPFTASH